MKNKSVGGFLIHKGKIAIVSNRGKSYTLPKGHMEKGESELETLHREIYEETGIKNIEIIKRIGEFERKTGRAGKRIIAIFLATTKESKLEPIDFRNPEAHWVSYDKALEMVTHKEDKKFMIEKRLEVEKYL